MQAVMVFNTYHYSVREAFGDKLSFYSIYNIDGLNCCNLPEAKVSESRACNMAASFWEEICNLPGAETSKSASFLQEATRLVSTGHETRLGQTFKKHNLSAKLKVSFLDCHMSKQHPFLGIRDFVEGLSQEGQMETLFQGHDAADYARFWDDWCTVQPDHPVFHEHSGHLHQVVPIWVHADEGTSQKKKGLMVLSWQGVLGQGTQRQPGSSLNYLGPSVSTRCLFSVMSTQLYSKASKKKRLLTLAERFAKDLQDCFEHPVDVIVNGEASQVYLACLGMKGDWPALVKLGNLRRHHLRVTWTSDSGAGICHFCKAGMPGNTAWHDVSYRNMAAMRVDAPAPWSTPPALIKYVPHSILQEPYFFRIDLFHLMHKGVLADVAANAIVFCQHFGFRVNPLISLDPSDKVVCFVCFH